MIKWLNDWMIEWLNVIISIENEAVVKTRAYLLPQLCKIYPMKYSTYKTICFLPSIISYLRTVHGINEVVEQLNNRNVYIQYPQLLEAFIGKDITQSFNYDIMEFYGDTFLLYF